MKNFNITKTISLIAIIAFLLSAYDLFWVKDGNKTYHIISTCLIFFVIILGITFGGKLEQEKIEREKGKN